MSPPTSDPAPARRNDDHLRLLMDNVRDYAIFTADPDGIVSSWNASSERTLGYAEAEIVGRPMSILYTPDDIRAGAPEQELAQALVTGRGEDERWHVRRDGSRIWCSGIVSPLHDEAGAHRGFGKVMRDLTDRKRLEDDLTASESAVPEHRRTVAGPDLAVQHHRPLRLLQYPLVRISRAVSGA